MLPEDQENSYEEGKPEFTNPILVPQLTVAFCIPAHHSASGKADLVGGNLRDRTLGSRGQRRGAQQTPEGEINGDPSQKQTSPSLGLQLQ